ncbi:hypothetical protein FACS1894122_02870 [Alphaproteobacteria bacterium]|nr:hypothetical protein FACS1894122_02870 [Alphaproteobacteria bacterium]
MRNMKNRVLRIVSSMMLTLSVVGTTCSANATAFSRNAEEATCKFQKGADSETTEQKIAIIKNCFKRESIYGDDVYRISGEQLFEFLDGKLLERDRKYFDRLKILMDQACNLEASGSCDSDKECYDLAVKIAGLYLGASGGIFCFEKGMPVCAWEESLFEMTKNPLGAKLMLSLLLLRRISNSDVAKNFAYKFNHSILVKHPAPGKDGKQSEEENEGNAFYREGKLVFCPEDSPAHPVASVLMHEFTHFYHYLLFGCMSHGRTLLVNMSFDDNLFLTKTLFPTKNLGGDRTFSKFSDGMLTEIGQKTVNKASLVVLLEWLKNTDDKHTLQITKEKHELYKARLSAATAQGDLRRIAADLIAEYAFSHNYWTTAEEMLTIAGVVHIKEGNGRRVVVVDSGHETSFCRGCENSWALSSTGNMDAIRFWHGSTLFKRVTNTNANIWNVLQSLWITEAYNKTIDEYQNRTRVKVWQMCQEGKMFGNYYCDSASLPQWQLNLLRSAYGFAPTENSNNCDIIRGHFALKSTDVDDVPAEKLFEYVKNIFLPWKEWALDECEFGSHRASFDKSCEVFVTLGSLMDEVCELEKLHSYFGENSSRVTGKIMAFYRKNGEFRGLFDIDGIFANGKLLFEDALRKMIENPSGAKKLLSLLLLRNIVKDVQYGYDYGMTGCRAAICCIGDSFACKFDHHILITIAASEEESMFSPEGYISLPLYQERTEDNIRRLSGILMRELTSFYRFLLLGTMQA